MSGIANYLVTNCYRQDIMMEICDQYGYTPTYFNRLFSKKYGISPYKYILKSRLAKAKMELRYKDVRITQIAENSGFNSIKQFSETFTKKTGITPKEYRKKYSDSFEFLQKQKESIFEKIYNTQTIKIVNHGKHPQGKFKTKDKYYNFIIPRTPVILKNVKILVPSKIYYIQEPEYQFINQSGSTSFVHIMIEEKYMNEIAEKLNIVIVKATKDKSYILSWSLMKYITELQYINSEETNQDYTIKILIQMIIIDLFKHIKNSNNKVKIEEDILENMAEYFKINCVKRNLIENTCEKFKVNRQHFVNEFLKQYGKTPYQYIANERIKYSKILLKDTNKEIREIAEEVGFYTASHFSTAFKKKMGISPEKYRKSHN